MKYFEYFPCCFEKKDLIFDDVSDIPIDFYLGFVSFGCWYVQFVCY